jgi:asparagine synthase (glutamine-hydrolysing)
MLEVDVPDSIAAASIAGVELLFPYAEKKFAARALFLGSEHKLDKKTGMNKKIIRELALELGLPEWMALRPKRAAQYGSNFDKALDQLAKKNGFRYKADYLKAVAKAPLAAEKPSLPREKSMKLGALVSTGKDSLYSLYLMEKQGYEVPCIISIESENKDSFMYHTPTIGMAELQAEAMGKKLVLAKSRGEKEKELVDLKKAIALAKKKFGIGGVITGALFSEYQGSRVDRMCADLGLKHFAPLWHMNQADYLRQLVASGFEAIITRIACAGMGEKWLGRKIDSKAIEDLVALDKKCGINVAGEGGEYESLVLNAPMFRKRIAIEKSEKLVSGENTGILLVKKAKLVSK